jgi:hypothetical protein
MGASVALKRSMLNDSGLFIERTSLELRVVDDYERAVLPVYDAYPRSGVSFSDSRILHCLKYCTGRWLYS